MTVSCKLSSGVGKLLINSDGKLMERCCDDDYSVSAAEDMDATFVTLMACRKRWCIRLNQWGNDGSHPAGTCTLESTLGETIKDYYTEAGCGVRYEEQLYPDLGGNPGLSGSGSGQAFLEYWTADNYVLNGTDISVILSIYNNNQIAYDYSAGSVDPFDGATITVDIEQQGGLPWCRAYWWQPFPFTIGELLGPHCSLPLEVAAPDTKQSLCMGGLVDIW